MTNAFHRYAIARFAFERERFKKKKSKRANLVMTNRASASIAKLSQRLQKTCPRLLGVGRLIKIVFGVGSEDSQAKAGHFLMVLGFCIEGWIMTQVLMDNLGDDAGKVNFIALLQLPLSLFFVGVMCCLLFHQFVIFRNFSLPKNAAAQIHYDLLRAAIANLRTDPTNTTKSDLEQLKLLALVPPPAIPSRFSRTSKSFIEISIYLLFGVLTGEAGYMLTVIHERYPSNWSVSAAFTTFGTQTSWGHTLECTFLLCAALICITVLVWDTLVILSPAKHQYNSFWFTFFSNDVLSLLFWTCLIAVVTPRARSYFGAVDSSHPGKLPDFWFFLLVFGGVYACMIGSRIWKGLEYLGRLKTYDEARFVAI
jgi:hypothetical protein